MPGSQRHAEIAPPHCRSRIAAPPEQAIKKTGAETSKTPVVPSNNRSPVVLFKDRMVSNCLRGLPGNPGFRGSLRRYHIMPPPACKDEAVRGTERAGWTPQPRQSPAIRVRQRDSAPKAGANAARNGDKAARPRQHWTAAARRGRLKGARAALCAGMRAACRKHCGRPQESAATEVE
jgi:hypothetical protein